MKSQVVAFTTSRCPELAQFLNQCCTTPLAFEGDCPNAHSAHNHIHLWSLEWWADHHKWIDLDYRVAFVEHIFSAWRGRLKGLPPYRKAGYRFYLYEDLAPTISVVAETPEGFPYPGEPNLVSAPRDIMALYSDRSWSANFQSAPWKVSRERILETIAGNAGSIGKPSASFLGLKTGQLRTLIEQMMLDRDVNAIRKRFKRRPAKFREDEDPPYLYHIYEKKLPARYR